MYKSVILLFLGMMCGCITSPPSELFEIADSSQCENNAECCYIIDQCSARTFALDRSQTDQANAVLAHPFNNGIEFCARAFAGNFIPMCQNNKCVILEIVDDNSDTLENVNGAKCFTEETFVPQEIPNDLPNTTSDKDDL